MVSADRASVERQGSSVVQDPASSIFRRAGLVADIASGDGQGGQVDAVAARQVLDHAVLRDRVTDLFWRRPVGLATRCKDLAQWAAGSAGASALGDPFAFLAFYGEAPGLPDYDELIAAIEAPFEKILERKAERIRTRPEREPDGPPMPEPLPYR